MSFLGCTCCSCPFAIKIAQGLKDALVDYWDAKHMPPCLHCVIVALLPLNNSLPAGIGPEGPKMLGGGIALSSPKTLAVFPGRNVSPVGTKNFEPVITLMRVKSTNSPKWVTGIGGI